MKTSVPTAIESFAGPVLHGRPEVLDALDDLAGRRVALLGDTTEVARLVARVARRAESLSVFQDEGPWVLPRVAGAVPAVGALLGPLPGSLRRRITTDVGRRHLRWGVGDAWTRRQLTPRRAPDGTNVVYSDRYHRALRRSDVRLVTWPIAGFVADGIRTADGIEHHVDVIAQL